MIGTPARLGLFILWSTLFCFSLLLADPIAAQIFFTDVTEGIIGRPLPGARPDAGSIAFGDYNNDGRPDLFIAAFGGSGLRLLYNEGNGRFTDRTAAIRADIPSGPKGGGAIFGDYDNDGDLDLYLPVGHVLLRIPDVLLRNDRGVFQGVTHEAGLVDILPTDNAVWLDYDRDGHLDLYVGHWFLPSSIGGSEDDPELCNKLHRNNGDGTFTDVTEEAGLNLQLHPTGGGSVHGIGAGDFDNDGWPDLYLGVWNAPNRLFLSDGQGGFRDATAVAMEDSGKVFGVSVGDIDNDGDLDIFQAGGGGVGGGTTPSPSFLFSNLGEGRFANVANEAGLSILYEVPPTYLSENAITNLVDIDNDGDLDLLIGSPFVRLFENNGDGTFVEQTSRLGIDTAGFFSFADFDQDGFLDVWVAGGRAGESITFDPALYRNNANDNHYLRVELVGIESNRNGIGARLKATSGDLQQTRDIFGGNGFTQEEMVAHFGLGPHTQVHQLEIRWPSGVVDVLSDVPADQKIRVFEGQEDYYVVQPTVWENNFPDSVLVGETIDLTATVRPALFEAGAEITQVTADLSGLGGPEAVPLMDRGDGTYRLEPVILAVGDLTGLKIVSILIEQATLLGPYWTNLSKGIRVLPVGLPTEDLVIFADGLAENGQVEIFQGKLDFQEDTVVHQGQFALAVESELPPVGGPPGEGFAFIYLLADPVDPLSYKSLGFAFHPGDAIRPSEGEAFFNVDFRSANTPT